jgi:Ca2+:H+ antiporter
MSDSSPKLWRRAIAPRHLISLACLIALGVAQAYPGGGVVASLLTSLFLGVAVMSSVHHAEIIAHKIGEGLGTLVLALCVTIIEVGLIIILMREAGPDAPMLARDTVFAAVMFITNGMVALCLILGGLRYREQEFQVEGSRSLLVVLITLSMLVFVLPNFTTSTDGPTYNDIQLIFTAVVCILLYLLFISFQTRTHKEYFEPVPGRGPPIAFVQDSPPDSHDHDVTRADAILSLISLCLSLIAVIGLAKMMSPTIEKALVSAGAPRATVGILIAVIVLLPETWAAAAAARRNRLQTSLNLALGSGIASIALTIPAVVIYSMATDMELVLGLDPKNMVFLITTFLVGALTLGTGKSTLLQGAVHAVILLAYFVMSFVP